jgi:hypothetical protein
MYNHIGRFSQLPGEHAHQKRSHPENVRQPYSREAERRDDVAGLVWRSRGVIIPGSAGPNNIKDLASLDPWT